MNLPIYLATITDSEDGIYSVSLVQEPATMVNWVTFSEDSKIEKFAIQNEEEHLLAGVVMLADTNIYRRDGDYEYYIRYDKETIKMMAEKMLKDNTFNNIDLQHDGMLIDNGKVTLVELFIKDEEKGINPNYLSNVPNGSLLCTYKVNDEELWELCKNGTFQGFSLSGYFTPVLKKEDYNKIEKKSYMNKLKELLSKMLMNLGAVETDKGVIIWEGAEDLQEGMVVTKEDGSELADGDYQTQDGKIISIEGGKVATIKDIEAQVAPEESNEEMKKNECMEDEKPEEVVEEVVEEKPEEVEEAKEPEYDAKAEIEALKAEIEALKATVTELVQKPAVEPVVEQFEKVTEVEKTGIKGLDKAISRVSKLKN